jgi:hypothetical protein
LLPVGTHFEPYKVYDLWYEATGSTVLGTGFAATRDLVSFLRYEHADRNGTKTQLPATITQAEITTQPNRSLSTRLPGSENSALSD